MAGASLPTAGQLRHRVEIHRNAADPAAGADQTVLGEVPEQDELVATVWADVQEQGTREFYYASQVRAEITHLVIVRYRQDLNAQTWFVTTDAKRLNCNGAPYNPDGKNIWLYCPCLQADPITAARGY